MTGATLGGIAAATAAATAAITAGLFRYGNGRLSITRYTVSLPALPEAFCGMRLVHLSDLHAASFGKDQQRLLAAIEALSPDMVIITGDLIDRRRTGDERGMRPALTLLNALGKRYPTVRVDGNHEPRSRVGALFAEKAAATPVTDITGTGLRLTRADQSITLVGIPDMACFDHDEAAWADNMHRQLAEYDGDFLLALSHRPQFLKEYAAEGLPLVLCGHAHGGQWRLPLIGALYAPEQGVFPQYTEGVHREGDTHMVISRGLGNSGFPLRLFNRPEIVEIVLKINEKEVGTMQKSSNTALSGYHRANRAGAMLLIMTVCQYGIPALFFGILRGLLHIDTAADQWGLPSAGYLCIYLFMYILTMGVPLWIGTRMVFTGHRPRLSPLNLSLDRRVSVVLCGVALCVLANMAAAMLTAAGHRLGLPKQEPLPMGDGSIVTLLLDLIVYAVVPAVMEEALLRGVVLQTLRPLGNGIAVTVSAVLFGLMHGNLAQVPYATLMGLVLGIMFVYTDDLRMTIFIHAIANALSVVARFMLQFSDTASATFWELVILIAVLMMGAVAALWLWRHPLERSRPVYDRPFPARLKSAAQAPLLWAAIVLMTVLMIVGNVI